MSTPATPDEPVPSSTSAPSSAPVSAPVPSPAQLRRLDRVIVGWLTLLVLVSTLFAVLFLPLYVGVVPVPVSALIGAGVVYVAIRLSYRLTGSMVAALAPALGWLVAAGYLSFSRTLGYPLVIGDWRATLLLGVGALAAAVGLGLCWGTHQLGPVVRSRTDAAASPPGVPGVTTDRTPAGR
jgi:hypothetical protein